MSGRGFGPGLPTEGAPVLLRRNGDDLVIDGWPAMPVVAVTHLAASRRGESLLLEWDDAAGRCAVTLDAAQAEKVGLGGTAKQPRHDRATRLWLWGTLFLLIGLPLLLLALAVGFRGVFIDGVTAWIPVEQEKQLADQLWPMQKAQLKLIEGTAANKAVTEIGARLVAAKPSPYTYRFHVAEDRTVNAFAMPAGYIVVHRGLIEKAASAEELAGVLAHEIEHVEGRHALRGMVQALGFHALWLTLTGDLGGGLAGEGARQLAGLHFSREQETAADQGGLARLLKAGIDPRGMASFFDKLAQEQAAMPDLLSSHPASSERSARLLALMANVPRQPPLAYDWLAIRASLIPRDKR